MGAGPFGAGCAWAMIIGCVGAVGLAAGVPPGTAVNGTVGAEACAKGACGAEACLRAASSTARLRSTSSFAAASVTGLGAVGVEILRMVSW